MDERDSLESMRARGSDATTVGDSTWMGRGKYPGEGNPVNTPPGKEKGDCERIP